MSKPTPEENADAIEENADAIEDNADEVEHNAHNIEDNADANTKQQSDIEAITADNPDDAGLQVDGSELPSSNTPKGANQRIKLFAPTPESIITIGHNHGTGGAYGEQGINLGTEQSLNVTIEKNTKVYSGEDRYVHTGQALTSVSGADMSVDSKSKYKLRTDKGVEITAGGTQEKADTWQVLNGVTDGKPPTVDTETPGKNSKKIGQALSAVFTAIKWRSVLGTRKKFNEKKFATFEVKDAGPIIERVGAKLNATKAALDAWEAIDGTLDAVFALTDNVAGFFDWYGDPIDLIRGGRGGASVKIHASDAIKLSADANIGGFARRSVGFKALQKISLAGGVSFSAKALGSSSVFGATGAKLDSWGIVKVGSSLTPSVKIEAKNHLGMTGDIVDLTSANGMEITTENNSLKIDGPNIDIGMENISIANREDVSIKGKKTTLSGEEVVMGGQRLVNIKSEEGDVQMDARRTLFLSACSENSKMLMQKHGILLAKEGGGRVSLGNGGVYLKGKDIKARGKCHFG